MRIDLVQIIQFIAQVLTLGRAQRWWDKKPGPEPRANVKTYERTASQIRRAKSRRW